MTTEPEPKKSIQITGAQDDPLITRIERFAEKRGIRTATAARMLIKAALDLEEKR